MFRREHVGCMLSGVSLQSNRVLTAAGVPSEDNCSEDHRSQSTSYMQAGLSQYICCFIHITIYIHYAANFYYVVL